MRRLHAVGLHEKFIASGKYHIANPSAAIDDPNEAVEIWSLHVLPDSSQVLRADQQRLNGHFQIIELLRSADGHIQRVDTLAQYLRADGWIQDRTTYTCFADHVEIGQSLRHSPGGQVERWEAEQPLIEGFEVDAGAMGARGWLLLTAARQGCASVLTLPTVADDAACDSGALDAISRVRVETLCVRLGAVEPAVLHGRAIPAVEVMYGASSDRYEGQALVDENAIMLLDVTRRRSARLVQYARKQV